MTQILGPVACLACGRPVWWDRVGTSLRLMEGRKAHACPGPVDKRLEMTCGAWMRNTKERCARQYGHAGDHRRRLVMDERAVTRRAKRAAA